MGNRILGITMAVACALFITSANAQINLSASVINFRTSLASDLVANTIHYGRLQVNGTSPTGSPYVFPASAVGYSSLTVTENTTSGAAIAGINPSANTGTGGFFSGGTYGVYGISNAVNASAYHYGGRFTASGGFSNFGIRSTAPVQANSYAGYFEGTLLCTQNPIVYSDDKLKINEKDITGSLEKVLRLKPKSYEYDTTGRWKTVFSPNRHTGFIAQQVEEIFPEMVTEVTPPLDSAQEMDKYRDQNLKRETYKAVDYVALIPVLVNAIQEQQIQIDELQKTVKILRGY